MHYVLEVRRKEHLDDLTVIVEARPGSADPDSRARAAADLARHIKGRIGLTTQVRVLEPGQVERSIGKAKRVIDLRDRR